jgi:hypothetical protein
MKKLMLILIIIAQTFLGYGQNRYDKLMGQVVMAEDYPSAKAAFQQLEQITCMVDYYPLIAAKALEENHRFEGVSYLDKALRYGYSLQEFEIRYNPAYQTLSQVTKDSLTNYLSVTNTLNFNWQERQKLESIFVEDLVNAAEQKCDTNERILAAALRNLLNQYMRVNGLPSDCRVGYGMRMKSVRLIYNRSHLLFDSEWEQLEEILFAATKNHQISLPLYASIVDTYLYLKFGTLRYGSNRYGPNQVQISYIKNNLEAINENRRSIGLEAIKREDLP